MYKNIGEIILEQLGGNKFIVMTGAHDFIWDSDKTTLRMTLPKNGSKANRLYIKYNSDDTYTMRFFKYSPARYKVDHKKCTCDFIDEKITEVKTYSHIYCDQLQELFTEVTKMYTHL